MKRKPQILPPSVSAVHKPNATIEVMVFSFMMSDSFLRYSISPVSFRVLFIQAHLSVQDPCSSCCHFFRRILNQRKSQAAQCYELDHYHQYNCRSISVWKHAFV
jgi:hypothetical protein